MSAASLRSSRASVSGWVHLDHRVQQQRRPPGTLLSLAGLFAWLTIMVDLVALRHRLGRRCADLGGSRDRRGHRRGRHLTFAALDEANLLRTESLPSAHEAVVAAAEAAEAEFGADWRTMGPAGLSNDAVDRLVEIQIADAEFGVVVAERLTPDQVEGLSLAEVDAFVAAEQRRNEATTWSELAAVAPA